ncbi:MAG: hypothetical protein Q4A24_06505 [Akkermansia sp.]|nr:hypothetical protein [Akkermansia sp.]
MITGWWIVASGQESSFYQGGEFFTQLAFTAMASIVFSTHVSDFLVIRKDEEAEKLRSEIQKELAKEPICEEQNQQYTDSHKAVVELIRKIDRSKCIAVVISRVIATICMLIAFWLLITGHAKDAGCLPLLAFFPIGCARWILIGVLNRYNSQLTSEKKTFQALQIAYEATTRKVENQAAADVDKAIESVPKKTRRKPKASTCSPPAL